MAAEAKAPCIIRLSRTFKNAGDSIERAWAEKVRVAKRLANFQIERRAHSIAFVRLILTSLSRVRLTVVHSTSLEDHEKERTMGKSVTYEKGNYWKKGWLVWLKSLLKP